MLSELLKARSPDRLVLSEALKARYPELSVSNTAYKFAGPDTYFGGARSIPAVPEEAKLAFGPHNIGAFKACPRAHMWFKHSSDADTQVAGYCPKNRIKSATPQESRGITGLTKPAVGWPFNKY